MNIVELFAGIGSQKKALTNLGIDHNVLNIAEWYIPAILAYDSIHYGQRKLEEIKDLDIQTIKTFLKQYTYSMNGKKPIDKNRIDKMNHNLLKNLYIATKRTNNLVSIDKVKGDELPNKIDVLTYSFPCQDLSNVGAFHGYKNGIDKGVKSRSGLLWEVERIMLERVNKNDSLPRVLLMENVSSLLAKRHKNNFDSWISSLKNMGYSINEHFLMNSKNFGIPQNRKRIFMISVLTKDLTKSKIEKIEEILKSKFEEKPPGNLNDFLRLSRTGEFLQEAIDAQPNDTVSRKTIYEKNYYLSGNKRETVDFCATITTRQDRHPNSGIIEFKTKTNNYRFLTAREVFLLMGFDETDYEKIKESNFMRNKSQMFFTRDKYYVLAGNSIVVDVLEEIFKKIEKITNVVNGG